jgi:hypothetical protein
MLDALKRLHLGELRLPTRQRDRPTETGWRRASMSFDRRPERSAAILSRNVFAMKNAGASRSQDLRRTREISAS